MKADALEAARGARTLTILSELIPSGTYHRTVGFPLHTRFKSVERVSEGVTLEAIRRQVEDSIAVKQAIRADGALLVQLQAVATQMVAAYRAGGKVLLAGNGGSAADAQHIAAELVGRFYFDRPALAALALTTNTSILTAVGNDYGYEALFARQVEAHGRQGDLFIGITTSGRSPNILAALTEARRLGMITVGLTGANGQAMAPLCDHFLAVPSADTPRIQEGHILIGHILCALVESAMYDRPTVTSATRTG
ncbi:D-sedoheptulose 7-phosphate isomerase [Gammaproteobacteria bacterium]